MATTSIWRVKGYISKVLLYAQNPDKTRNPERYYRIDGDIKAVPYEPKVTDFAR